MEETLITSLLGNTPTVRVLDMLYVGQELEYSKSDIAEQANISRPTFYRMMDRLLKEEIIKEGGKYGRIQLYKLNADNYAVKALIKCFDTILKEASERELARQGYGEKIAPVIVHAKKR